jgi:tetratricopeptide (TPR) repeat protein
MTLRSALAVGLLLAACRKQAPLPPLPEVSTASFLPAIRQAVDSAVADAKARPNDAAAVGRLGMTLHAHQQLAAARICYQRAALLDPGNFDWQYYFAVVSEGQAAVDALRAALRLRDYLPAKLRLGEALLASGDSAAASQVYRGLDHPAALFGYGRATNDASYYEKALAQFPSYGAAMFALAQHYQRTGRAADAQRLMDAYPKVKMTVPPVDDPLIDAVLESDGHLQAAADLQLRALELDPNLAQAHINLISLYGRLGDLSRAEQHYRQAIALNAGAAEAYYNFGVLCYQSKRLAEARAALEKALAINPAYAEAHNNLGVLLQEQGSLDLAARHFEQAIQLQPGLRLARFHLGRIFANQQRFAQAIEQFERAVEVDDESTPAYLYALGATQARAGDAARAASTLATAREKALSRGQSSLAQSIERDLARLKR